MRAISRPNLAAEFRTTNKREWTLRTVRESFPSCGLSRFNRCAWCGSPRQPSARLGFKQLREIFLCGGARGKSFSTPILYKIKADRSRPCGALDNGDLISEAPL